MPCDYCKKEDGLLSDFFFLTNGTKIHHHCIDQINLPSVILRTRLEKLKAEPNKLDELKSNMVKCSRELSAQKTLIRSFLNFFDSTDIDSIQERFNFFKSKYEDEES